MAQFTRLTPNLFVSGITKPNWEKAKTIVKRSQPLQINQFDAQTQKQLVIRSQVQGSISKPYQQTIKLNLVATPKSHSASNSANFFKIEGVCSCPVKNNCKHVAAVLLSESSDITNQVSELLDTSTLIKAPASDSQLPANQYYNHWMSELLALSHQTQRQTDSTHLLPKKNKSSTYTILYLFCAMNQQLILIIQRIGKRQFESLQRGQAISDQIDLHPINQTATELISNLPNYFIPDIDLPILALLTSAKPQFMEGLSYTYPLDLKLISQLEPLLEKTVRVGHFTNIAFDEPPSYWQLGTFKTQNKPVEINWQWNIIDNPESPSKAPICYSMFTTPTFEANSQHLLWLPNPMIYCSQTNQLAPVKVTVESKLFKLLAEMPPSPQSELKTLFKHIAKRIPKHWAEQLEKLALLKKTNQAPKFRVRLTKIKHIPETQLLGAIWNAPLLSQHINYANQRVAVLEVTYDGHTYLMVSPKQAGSTLLINQNTKGQSILAQRKLQLEAQTLRSFCIELPLSSWLHQQANTLVFDSDTDHDEVMQWLLSLHRGKQPVHPAELFYHPCRTHEPPNNLGMIMKQIRQWCAEKQIEWVIDSDSTITHHAHTDVVVEVNQEQDSAWLDTSFKLRVADQDIELTHILSQVLEAEPSLLKKNASFENKTVTVSIDPDETIFVDIQLSQLEPIIHLLKRLTEKKQSTLQFRSWEFGEFHALSNQVNLKVRPELLCRPEDFKAVLRDHQTEISTDFQAELRPYQTEGVTWLQLLAKIGMNGLLADDMGLGKTVQTLALISKQAMNRSSLVICPNSLVHNWQDETHKFLPHFKTFALVAGNTYQKDDLTGIQLVICPYSMVARLVDLLESIDWHWLIVDESQRIKNANTLTAKLIKRFNCDHKLALSGTPIENHLGELWSQMDFLMPGLLGSQLEFNQQWRKPIEQSNDLSVSIRLAARVRPFMMRRTKEQVAHELPGKTEQIIRVAFSDKQAQAYETVRVAMDAKVRQALSKQGYAKSQILFLEALLRLRQICCHPALVGGKAPSAKLELLLDLLTTLAEEGRRVLVFSQFAQMLELIETELNELKIPCVKLTGETKNRKQIVAQFSDSKIPVFLISLKAGGVGLNLTQADTVIIFDPWWNPAAEQQAIDRAYRIGQTNHVNVIRIIAENTVEEKVLKLQAKKADLADQILEGKNLETVVTESEMLNLLGALHNESRAA